MAASPATRQKGNMEAEHGELLHAASRGDVQEVSRLQARLREHYRSYGASQTIYKALQYAARNGHSSIVKELLDNVSPDLWCSRSVTKDKQVKEDLDAICIQKTYYGEKAGWYFYGDEMMESPLHLAVKEGHLEVVQQIGHFFLDKRVLHQVHSRDAAEDKSMAQHNLLVWFEWLVRWAVRWGHVGIVQLLLTPPFLFTPQTEAILDMDLPVHLAAQHNHLDVLKWLLEAEATCSRNNLHVQLFSEDGLTALHLAAQSGFTDMVDFLLNSGRNDVNERSHPDSFAPLHMAASSGQADVVCLLLRGSVPKRDEVPVRNWKVDICATDRMGRTALHYAAREGHHDVVQLLLDAMEGAGIAGILDLDGLLALHMAARGGHVEVVRKLICRHAGSIDSLARHRLEMRGCFAEEFIRNFDCDEYMMHRALILGSAKFCRPNQVDSLFWKTEGFTPLHFAARYGHEAVVRELIKGENGKTRANVHLRDHAGFLAFDWMEVQNKGAAFLKCVEDGYGSAVASNLQDASCVLKMTKKMRSTIVEDVDEEKEAMEELQSAAKMLGNARVKPPFTMCVLRWLMQEPAYLEWTEDVLLVTRGGKVHGDVAVVIGKALKLALIKRSERLAQEILLLLDEDLIESFTLLVLDRFFREPKDELIGCIRAGSHEG